MKILRCGGEKLKDCGAHQYSSDLISKIHVDEVHDLSLQDLANAINKAFLYPLEEYGLDKPLARLPTDEAVGAPYIQVAIEN